MKKNPITLPISLIALALLDLVYVCRDYVFSINNQSPLAWDWNIASNSSDAFFWLPFIPLIFLIYQRFNWRQFNGLNKLIPLTLLIAFFHRFLVVYLGKYIEFNLGIFDAGYYERVQNYYFAIISGGTINDLIFVWIIIGIYITLDYIKKYQNEQAERLQLSKQLTDAKLTTLQGQLQPHFLFNTLHTVSSLMEENVEKAQQMMSRLGTFLRYSLDYQDKQFASVGDEIDFIKTYLDIETERFRDRLSVSFEIEDQTLKCKIPAFILQPFIENIFKHGVSKHSSVNQILISAQSVNQNLTIEICQNGKTVDPDNIKQSKGIGIANTIKRLDTIYKNDYELNFFNEKGLTIQLILPIEIIK